MKTEPCVCCQDGKSGIKGGQIGYGYNRLEGEAREWAKDNGFARSEHCVSVKGGKRFGGANWQKQKCGDGRMGFSTRRKNVSEVRIERGLMGQSKRKRSTLINKRSARAAIGRKIRRIDGSRCGLVSNTIIMEIQRDPLMVAQQRKVHKKAVRSQNRNNKARRGHKKAA